MNRFLAPIFAIAFVACQNTSSIEEPTPPSNVKTEAPVEARAFAEAFCALDAIAITEAAAPELQITLQSSVEYLAQRGPTDCNSVRPLGGGRVAGQEVYFFVLNDSSQTEGEDWLGVQINDLGEITGLVW